MAWWLRSVCRLLSLEDELLHPAPGAQPAAHMHWPVRRQPANLIANLQVSILIWNGLIFQDLCNIAKLKVYFSSKRAEALFILHSKSRDRIRTDMCDGSLLVV